LKNIYSNSLESNSTTTLNIPDFINKKWIENNIDNIDNHKDYFLNYMQRFINDNNNSDKLYGYMNLAYYYYFKKDYHEAKNYFLLAYNNSENGSNEKFSSINYLIILLSTKLVDYKEASKYSKEALIMFPENHYFWEMRYYTEAQYLIQNNKIFESTKLIENELRNTKKNSPLLLTLLSYNYGYFDLPVHARNILYTTVNLYKYHTNFDTRINELFLILINKQTKYYYISTITFIIVIILFVYLKPRIINKNARDFNIILFIILLNWLFKILFYDYLNYYIRTLFITFHNINNLYYTFYILLMIFDLLYLILLKKYIPIKNIYTIKNNNKSIYVKKYIIFVFIIFSYIIINSIIYNKFNQSHNIEKSNYSNDNIFLLISTIIIFPILEEFVFRVSLYNYFMKYYDYKKFLIIGCLLFSLVHTSYSFYQLQLPIILHISLSYVYKKSNNCYSIIILHILYNSLCVLINTINQ
jgi:membrane protease YdiL (CAAX protease family)